jgi:hypothetical protein
MSKNFIEFRPPDPLKGEVFKSPLGDLGVNPICEIKGIETLESHFPSGFWPKPNFRMNRKS